MTWVTWCASLPPNRRRMVAVLLVPAIIALAWLLVYVPFVALRDAQVIWREDVRRTLSLAADADTAQAKLDEDLKSMRGSSAWARFYESDRQGSSAIALQADVSSLLSSVSAATQSLTALPSSALPHFTRIGLRLSASMRVDQLKSFLEALLRHQRYLRVEHLAVIAPQTQVPEENPPLAVTMEIHGFEISTAVRGTSATASTLALSESRQ